MKLTRRQWTAAFVVGTAAAAQERPDTPEDLRKAAVERLQRNSSALAKQKIPMATEPAFSFKA